MPAWVWVLISVGVLAGLGLAAWRSTRSRASHAVGEHVGPGLGRLAEERGNEHAAGTEPATRRDRSTLEIRPLTEAARRDYAERWNQTQGAFADSPQLAVAEADVLVRSLMRERGYPVAETEQRMTDLSVDHPDVMDHFRLATVIAAEAREERATAERLRQAMVHLRELFGRLLAVDAEASSTSSSSSGSA